MAKNIIEDYLVSIGCVVNQKEFTQANKKLAGIGDLLKKLFGIITSGAAAAVGAMVGLTAAIGPAGRALGNITMGVDKLALNLHTTTKNARSLQTVMQAMGIESLEDLKYINLIPEQRRQFMELRKVAAENAPSMQAREGLDELKKLGFEFQKFEVKLTGLGNEFLGGLGQALKEPLFKKVPKLLEVLLDLIKIIANEVVIFAKKLGSYKGFQDLNNQGFQDFGRSTTKFFGLKPKSRKQLDNELNTPGLKKKTNIDPFDPGSIWYNREKNPEISRAPGVRTSPALDQWLSSLPKTGNRYTLSSGLSHSGHAPRSKHYQGLAADIGAAGKTPKELADLAQSALASPLTKNLNVELFGKLEAFMGELRKRGLDKDSKLTFDRRFSKGEHLHFAVAEAQKHIERLVNKTKPNTGMPTGLGGVPGGAGTEIYGKRKVDKTHTATTSIIININGAKHPTTVADEVHKRLTEFARNRDGRSFA